jgi:CubicO group peptidase (beta-lactamase class C family)
MEHSMRRTTHRLAVLGVVGGLVLAATPAATLAGADELKTINGECVVQHVDERAQVTDTTFAREGEVYAQFSCAKEQWELTPSPFDRGDTVTSPEIQVDPAGNVSVQRIVGPALGYGMTLGEMARVVQALTGDEVVVDKAVVAVDDGRQRTHEEIQALLAGKDTTGARVLGVVDRPDAAMSTKDVIDETGGGPETTVVYFSIWGAIKGAIAWIVDGIQKIGEWISDNCHLEPSPTGDGIDLVCEIQW